MFHMDAGHMLEHFDLDFRSPPGPVLGCRGHVGLSGLDAGNDAVRVHRQDLFTAGFEGQCRVAGVGRLGRPDQLRRFTGIDRRCFPESQLGHRLLNVNRRLCLHLSVRLAGAGNFTVAQRQARDAALGVHGRNAFIRRSPGDLFVVCVLWQHSRLQNGALAAGVHGQLCRVQLNFLSALGNLEPDIGAYAAPVICDGVDPDIAFFHAGDVPVRVHRRDVFVRRSPGHGLQQRVLRQEGRCQGKGLSGHN